MSAYLTTEQAAEHIGISVNAFRMALVRGHLVPTGRIGRRLLFTVDDLHRQLCARTATIGERSVVLGSATQTAHAEKRNADGNPGPEPGWNDMDFAGHIQGPER